MDSGLGSTSFRKICTYVGRVGSLSGGQPSPRSFRQPAAIKGTGAAGLSLPFICLSVHSSGITFFLESLLSGHCEGASTKVLLRCSVGEAEALCARARTLAGISLHIWCMETCLSPNLV